MTGADNRHNRLRGYEVHAGFANHFVKHLLRDMRFAVPEPVGIPGLRRIVVLRIRSRKELPSNAANRRRVAVIRPQQAARDHSTDMSSGFDDHNRRASCAAATAAAMPAGVPP